MERNSWQYALDSESTGQVHTEASGRGTANLVPCRSGWSGDRSGEGDDDCSRYAAGFKANMEMGSEQGATFGSDRGTQGIVRKERSRPKDETVVKWYGC